MPLSDLTPDIFNPLDKDLKEQLNTKAAPDFSKQGNYLDYLNCRDILRKKHTPFLATLKIISKTYGLK